MERGTHVPNQERGREPMTAQEAQAIIERAITSGVGSREELLRHREAFAHVFATEGNRLSNGSVYFVLSSGEIIRNKARAGRDVSVMFDRHLFVSREDTGRFNQDGGVSGQDPLAVIPFVPIPSPEVGGSVIDYTDPSLFVDAAIMQGLIVEQDGRPRPLLLDMRLQRAGRHRSSPIREIL